MNAIATLQGLIVLGLGVGALGLEVFALVDALRHDDSQFVNADKRTRTFWLAVLVVAVLLGFVSVRNPLTIFGLLAFVAAAIYLADVRPAVSQMSRGGGSGTMGPYGPW